MHFQLNSRTFANCQAYWHTYLIIKRNSAQLKKVLDLKIPKWKDEIINFRKNYGQEKVAEVTVNHIYGGMRGVPSLICDTSEVDPNTGIRFRGLSIPDCKKLLPKAKDGEEPLPESVFWLLMTGDVPTEEQVRNVSKSLAERGSLSPSIMKMLKNFPKNVHPMSQLSSVVTVMNTDSKFKKAYQKGIKKTDYWEYILEDALELIAKLPAIAATIYINTFKDGKHIPPPSSSLDWSANFTRMLGYDNKDFTELMRLYLSIHSDHEGGNVSAHTAYLVGSALSDPYLAFASGLNGLAGPLHGLANQEVLSWLENMKREVGEKYTEDELKKFIWKTLKSGKVIPGYGHAVLRKADPRFTCQREFALKHLPNDPLFKLVSDVYKIVPPILMELGKVQNPWPNVDAHSGVLFVYYGMKEMEFYTVLFGVSRALGIMSSLVHLRAMCLPIERPKSLSTHQLKKLIGATT